MTIQIIGNIGQLLLGIAAIGNWFFSWKNRSTLKDVRANTNGLVKHLVADARAQGKQDEKENPTP